MMLLSAWRLGVERDRCPTVEVARYGPVKVAPVVTVRLRPLPPVFTSGTGSSSESSAPGSWSCEASVMNVDGIALVVVAVVAAPVAALSLACCCCCCFGDVVLEAMLFGVAGTAVEFDGIVVVVVAAESDWVEEEEEDSVRV